MNMKQLVVALLVMFVCRTFGIDITFDPEKPAQGDSVTISCKRSSSSGQSVSWTLDSILLTVCDGSTNNICIPSPPGYTFSTDVSADIFNLSLASVALTDCKTYACTDAVSSSDTDSKDLSIAKYDSSEIVLTEPGAFASGTITLTTGCVLSPSDVTISWKKVKQNGVEEDLDEITPSQTTDAIGCTDTCHSETSQKVVSSFEHNEYTGSDYEQVIFRAYIRHSSYSESTKDSVKYKVKKATLANPCLENPCVRGTCFSHDSLFLCQCPKGYTGKLCENQVDPCEPNPCQHGTCFSHDLLFLCQCVNGYYGKTCEKTVEPCRNNPCIHGTCFSRASEFLCKCQPGYTGERCDKIGVQSPSIVG